MNSLHNFRSLGLSILDVRDEALEMCKSDFYSRNSKEILRNVASSLMDIYCYLTRNGDIPLELCSDNYSHRFKNL